MGTFVLFVAMHDARYDLENDISHVVVHVHPPKEFLLPPIKEANMEMPIKEQQGCCDISSPVAAVISMQHKAIFMEPFLLHVNRTFTRRDDDEAIT